MTKTTKWDAVEYLETYEDIEAFLAEQPTKALNMKLTVERKSGIA